MEILAETSDELDLRQENAQLRASLDEAIGLLTKQARDGDDAAKHALVDIERIATEPFPNHKNAIEDLLYVRDNLRRRRKVLDRNRTGQPHV
ncbi:hypothetical protein [Methylocapsa acidiphila]|uniref:hypothetical protein n=1 Tax=Methylocapsa acidiphila TaxID=133552 RepID=UPI0012EB54B8|nr:hypothetical protein [Methylocapsa acidiphila]